MNNKYFIGLDTGVRLNLKWWQKALVWLGFKNRWTDKSCMVIWEKKNDGTMYMVDINYFN